MNTSAEGNMDVNVKLRTSNYLYNDELCQHAELVHTAAIQ